MNHDELKQNHNVRKSIRSFVVCLSFLAAFGLLLGVHCRDKMRRSAGQSLSRMVIPVTFRGEADGLRATEIPGDLNIVMPNGKNVIWSAGMAEAWQGLEREGGAPVVLDVQPEWLASLNGHTEENLWAPPANFYSAAGLGKNGVKERIATDLARRFPETYRVALPNLGPESLMIYSFLRVDPKPSAPFNQNEQPLAFTDGRGQTSSVNSFGIREEDDSTYYDLRSHVQVLFRRGRLDDTNFEFAVDLCADSTIYAVVLARIAREATLEAALARVKNGMAEWNKQIAAEAPSSPDRQKGIGPCDVLLVPNMNWYIAKRFSRLEGRSFPTPSLKGRDLGVARQDISLCLDRGGTGVESKAGGMAAAISVRYVFDRPFLLYLKKRNAADPFFAMWIDNDELLSPWSRPAVRSP